MKHRGVSMKQMIFILAVVSLFIFASCQPDLDGRGTIIDIPDSPTGSVDTPSTFDPASEVGENAFSSEEELRGFVAAHQGGSNYYGGGFGRSLQMMGDVVMESMAMDAPSTKAANDYSDTNVQVQGIDEGDILKTDGDYIYTVTENTLFIVKAYPGEDAEVVEEIEFDNRPTGLFVDGNYLAVFGNYYDNDYFAKVNIRPRYGMTFFDIYDISDKDDPELVKEFKFEGNYFQSRMIDGTVYFVVRSGMEYRPRPMPMILEENTVRHVSIGRIFYYDLPYQNPQFITAHVLDLNSRPDVDSTTVAVEGGQHMYMSPDNIYITSTEYINEWDLRQEITVELTTPLLSDSDKELIRKIERTDPDILSAGEKKQKIYQIHNLYVQYMSSGDRDDLEDAVEDELISRMKRYESQHYTVIHKLELARRGVTIGPSGKVPGSLNNQFAMDERDDVLRVATTLQPHRSWGWIEPMIDEVEDSIEIDIAPPRRESSASVFTLDEDLDVIDRLDGLGEGESIFATRFIGERLYLVTFRQVDPFFVIDLSNPRNIKELGELKIPGFSRYLHPYDEDTIIGIGRDATELGRQEGIKISLFDVSDVDDPEEVASWVADEKYSQSAAEWEHKAFLFSKAHNLLVIPAYSYDWDYREGRQQSYNGAMVFHIDEDDIDIRGIIDHSDGERRYGPTVERSLYIEKLLYTKSPYLLRINELDDLSSVKSIDLKTGKTGPYPVY